MKYLLMGYEISPYGQASTIKMIKPVIESYHCYWHFLYWALFCGVVIQTPPYYLCLSVHPSINFPLIYFYILIQNDPFWALCGQQSGQQMGAYSRLMHLWINSDYEQKPNWVKYSGCV